MSASLSSSLLSSSAVMPSAAVAAIAASSALPTAPATPALLPLRILVQSDMIGAIIGKSGGTIKQITQQTKAKIDVHREETEGLDQIEKIITITGSSEACSRACARILRIIENEKLHLASLSQQQTSTTQLNSNPIKLPSAPLLNNNNTNLINNNSQLHQLQQQQDNNHPNSAKKQQQLIAGGTNSLINNTDTSNITTWDQLDEHLSHAEIQLKILAHNNLIGRLIGRSGNSIKKIMEDTGTKINISSNSLTDCTQERTITVLGNYENILQAEQVISSKLRAAYSSDININSQTLGYHAHQPYLLNNVNPMSYMARQGPNAAIPFNQGRQKKPILATLAAAGAAGSGPGAGPPGYGNPLASRATGPATYGPMAGGYPNHHPHQHNSNPYMSFYPHGMNNTAANAIGGAAIGHGGVLGGFNSLLGASDSGDKVTVYMYVPIGAVGAIIGRSGSAIKEMISSSGASIKVSSMAISSASVNNNNNSQTSFENTQTKNNIDALSNSSNNNKVTNSSSNNIDKSLSQTINNLPSENISNANSLHHQNEVQNSHQTSNTTTTTTLISHNNNDHNNPTSEIISSTMNNNNNIIKGNVCNDQNQQSSVIPQYRKVTIVGSPESQWSAQFMIYKKVASESSKSDISLMLEITIPTSQVGKVIGKAGSTIKQIQKQTRTTIRLLDDKTASPQIVTQPPTPSPNKSDQEPETTVQITGEFHNSQMAQWQIRNLC